MTKFERTVLAGFVVITEMLSKILLSINGENYGDKDLGNVERFVFLVQEVLRDNDQK